VTTTMPLSRSMPLTSDASFVATAGPATVGTGERLGFYTAMARLESVTAIELAMAADASVWFTDAWLLAQTRTGYAIHDPATDRYALFCRLEG
jgi:hypothetical protein